MVTGQDLREYRDYVSARLSKIVLLLQKYATGDFSESIQIPEKEDEFIELLVGLSLMVDDIREMISTHTATADRAATATSEMIDAVTKVSRGDYSVQIELSGENDELDSLAMGLNMMIDDIRTSIEERVKAYQELQATQEASLNITEDLDRQGKELISINKQLQQEITERKRAEEALSNANVRLQVLQQVTAAVHSTLASREVFQQVTDGVAYSLGYNTAIILTLNEEKKCFETKSFSTQKRFLLQIARLLGFSLEKLSIPADFEFQASIRSVLEGRLVITKSLTEIIYPIISKKVCSALERLGEARNYILLPLKVGEKMVGALFITSPREEVTEDELAILQNFARAASQAITNANLHTQTKQGKEELKNSEERLRILFEFAPDAYYLNDLKGTFVDGNKSAEEIIGYKRDELIGKSFLKLKLMSLRQIPKAATLLAKNALGQPTGPDEFILNRKDGNQVPVEIRTFPVKIEGQTLVLSIARDVTERKQAEQRMERLNKVLKAISNVNQLITREKDRDRLIKSACDNLVEGCGYYNAWLAILDESGGLVTTAEAGLDKDFLPMVEQLKRGQLTACAQRALMQSAVVVTEAPSLTCTDCPLADKYAGRTAMTVRLERRGKVYGVLSFSVPNTLTAKKEEQALIREVAKDIAFALHDIELAEERERAEAERETLLKDLERINRRLEESNRELQDFVYIASHDLREPMRKITSFGTLLQDSLGGKLDEDQQENFEFMIDGSKRMQAMIDDLLTYSRVTTKAKSFQQVNLNNVIEDLKNLELAALLDETKGTIHVPETLPPVYGDSSQIHQLLQNLVANGLKFHHEGVPPEITIRARKENSMVRVEVQDNGIGIGEEYREQVFIMFKRLHSRTQYEGTGIGLAACKKIVQRHGGEIGIKSAPDEGSIFWFTLPRGSYSGNN